MMQLSGSTWALAGALVDPGCNRMWSVANEMTFIFGWIRWRPHFQGYKVYLPVRAAILVLQCLLNKFRLFF